jgi:Domain of unknown function (DUF4160)
MNPLKPFTYLTSIFRYARHRARHPGSRLDRDHQPLSARPARKIQRRLHRDVSCCNRWSGLAAWRGARDPTSAPAPISSTAEGVKSAPSGPSGLHPNGAWVTVIPVSTVRIGGIIFQLFPVDHEPRHVHALYAGTRVVLDLLDDRTVALASREDAIQPANAKRSDVKRILRVAAAHFDVLVAAWEKMHP